MNKHGRVKEIGNDIFRYLKSGVAQSNVNLPKVAAGDTKNIHDICFKKNYRMIDQIVSNQWDLNT